MRFMYGSGGMFMIDMQGTRDLATASSSSRTPGEPILRLLHRQADEIVVVRIDAGGAAGGHLARQLARIRASTGSLRPFTGKRTRNLRR